MPLLIDIEAYGKNNLKELSIRGSILQVCAKIEMVLCQIMIINDFGNLKKKHIPFQDLRFYEKINKAQFHIKQFSPSLYTKNKQIFGKLHVLKDFRNKMAHCGMTWEGEDFVIWEIEVDKKDKVHSFYPVKFTVSQAELKLKELKSIHLSLCKISLEMMEPVRKKFPDLF